MTPRTGIGWTLVSLAFLFACRGTATPAAGRTSDDRSVAADTAEIRRHTREFVERFNSGNVDLMMGFYADPYVDVNMPAPVQTWAERREYYRRIVERRDTRVAVTPDEIVISGDHAFIRGTIRLTPLTGDTTGGARERRYVEVARRFPEGWRAVWGIDADIYPRAR